MFPKIFFFIRICFSTIHFVNVSIICIPSSGNKISQGFCVSEELTVDEVGPKLVSAEPFLKVRYKYALGATSGGYGGRGSNSLLISLNFVMAPMHVRT